MHARADGCSLVGVEIMKAALYDSYGPPDVLYVGDVPVPSPGPGQVLVKVAASTVNGAELSGRAGRLRVVTGTADRGFPKQVGFDLAGEVAALGGSVQGYRVGDRVWGLLGIRFGTTAEYVVVDARRIALVPAGLDLVDAATLPIATTSVFGLRNHARLRPGERLLVRGAAGGVGHSAVQLGHAWGAHVTALASASTHDFVRGLGADEVLDRATTPEQLGRFDIVFDTVGTDLPAYRRLLTRTGRMVAVAFEPGRLAATLGVIAASAVHGPRRIRIFNGSGHPGHDEFAELARLVDEGALRPAVDRTFPLERIADAHRALEKGGVHGKIVVTTGAQRP